MSRMERLKENLTKHIAGLRGQVEQAHTTGKIPADYTLGFLNGLIFTEHHINMKSGEPKFVNRTSSIGQLPIPVALRTPGEQEEEVDKNLRIYYRNLCQAFIASSLELVNAMEDISEYESTNPDKADPELTKKFSEALAKIRALTQDYETKALSFSKIQEELANASQQASVQQEAAQGESSPSGALPSNEAHEEQAQSR